MENEFIEWLRQRLPPHRRLHIGLGDDAAIIQLKANAKCVVTCDTLTDHVDFELATCDPSRIGRKSLAVNLSDLAAMAVRPVAAFVSFVLPRVGGKQLAIELIEGLLPLAKQFDVAIAGGDTNSWDGPLVIGITAVGETCSRGVWLRSGAKVGDAILVTGSFGGSLLGKHLDFQPRVEEALRLNKLHQIHAAIDVSDGLSLDLSRMARESHCGAVLDLDAIPISADARRLSASLNDGRTPMDHALSDGEDFELIFATAPADADRLLQNNPLEVPLTRIGSFIAEPGLWRRSPAGTMEPLEPQGYQHRLDR